MSADSLTTLTQLAKPAKPKSAPRKKFFKGVKGQFSFTSMSKPTKGFKAGSFSGNSSSTKGY